MSFTRKWSQGNGSILLLVVMFLMIPVAAQGTSRISGVVKDSTGGVLPGVTVTAKNLDTGITRSVITDDGGRYRIPELSLGNYEVQGELTGFQTTVRRGLKLAIGLEAVIDMVLNVGEMTERVEVTGEAPQIETTTSTIAGLVDEKKVRDLPLNARSLIELAPLKTGIVFAEFGGTGNATVGYAKKLSIAGSRQSSSLFQLDGASITDRSGAPGSAAGLMMGVETIREFNLVTNAYSSEFGKHTGGVFNAVTKSGTNELHGSVFEFLRNDNLDARNFFDGKQPPEFKRNQFGFALGGPIVKNRTFIFGSYEGLRERLGLTEILNVLSNDARSGRLRNRAGQIIPIADTVKDLVALYPAPNGRDFGDGRAEFIRGVSRDTDEDFYTVRFDHNFSESDSFFARYTYDDAIRSLPATLNVLGSDITTNQYLTLGETKVFSPQLINKFIFAYNRSRVAQSDEPLAGYSLRSFTRFTRVGSTPVFGNFTVGGISGAGGRNLPSVFEINNYFQFKDDLYLTKGKHSLKFGADIERRQDNRTQGMFGRSGVFGFLNIEDFLRGNAESFNSVVTGDAERYFRQTVYGFYVQDDIKVNERLTINAGLRWDPTSDLVEKYGRISTLRFDYRTRLGVTVNDAVIGNPMFDNPSMANLAPRVGFAWDPRGDTKTSVRGGFGLFYEQLNSMHTSGGDVSVLPLIVVRGRLTASRMTVPIDVPNAFFTQNALLASQPEIDLFLNDPQQPYVMKWSLDLQRELFGGTVIEVGYTGTRGVHLPMIATWNPRQVSIVNGRLFVAQNAAVRHPALGRLRGVQTTAASQYHAVRLELNRRFANSLQFQVSYTGSKSIDDSSSMNGASDFSNDRGAAQRYLDTRDTGLSAFDVRHSFVFNFTYDLPGRNLTGVLGRLAGGWGVSGIGRFSSGHPVDLGSGAPPSWMTFVEDFPDLAPGVTELNIDSRNPNRYYDPSQFVLPAPGVIGNLGRNVLIGPGIANFDLVLTNNIRATERVNVQFRAELFNLFNRANFGLPQSNVFDPRTFQARADAGRITRTTTTARQIQFGLKVLF
ncbi:MAG: TonB-dependent receptor [Acidobacteria bacterium]|nr:TonB-dependent receptor [Acidobacteriota bacterium]